MLAQEQGSAGCHALCTSTDASPIAFIQASRHRSWSAERACVPASLASLLVPPRWFGCSSDEHLGPREHHPFTEPCIWVQESWLRLPSRVRPDTLLCGRASTSGAQTCDAEADAASQKTSFRPKQACCLFPLRQGGVGSPPRGSTTTSCLEWPSTRPITYSWRNGYPEPPQARKHVAALPRDWPAPSCQIRARAWSKLDVASAFTGAGHDLTCVTAEMLSRRTDGLRSFQKATSRESRAIEQG